MLSIPLIKEVNGIIVDETRVSRWGNRLSLRVIDRIERFNMPKADKIIVVTSRLKEILPKEYGVPSDKIVVIKNGANTDLFKPMDVTEARRELNLSRSDHYVCFVGRLWQMQRVGHLIKSAPLILEELPNTKFLIVGDGAMRKELISFADEVGVSDTMIFTGLVPHREVPIYINASDVCVILEDKNFRSERLGASPLKLYEYMACGKPVVVSNVEGASEDVADAGFVFDITNVNEMARAVVTLLKNEQLRKEMGKRGREIAVEKYSWRIIAEQVAKVCQSAIKAKENA
jgi:glycosyltransferase involved in cell wall biosynthesis